MIQLSARVTGVPTDEARREEILRCVLLELMFCGAALNGKSISLARAIAEVLVWSAEHARNAADRARDQAGLPEWQCGNCGEFAPANFDLCWNCEAIRPE